MDEFIYLDLDSWKQEVASKKINYRKQNRVDSISTVLLMIHTSYKTFFLSLATGNQLLLGNLAFFVWFCFGILSKPNKFCSQKNRMHYKNQPLDRDCFLPFKRTIPSFILAWHKNTFKEGSFYCYFGSTLLLLWWRKNEYTE